LHPHVWALATATNGITELQSGFPNEQTIRAYFAEDVANYQNRIREANNEDEKIAAIILFISIVEGSHFFDNGNNRLCCQILINKLLKEQGLDPTILFIPNGFSHYVLGILPWEVRLGLVELNEVPLEILTARLKPALMMVKEGEDFYRAVCTAGNSSTVVYTESANNV
jgi:hypothetical protein